jgi:hypothetical protein
VGTSYCMGCLGFQHTLAESWALLLLEAKLESLLCGGSMGARVDVRALDDVWKDSCPSSRDLGDSGIQNCLVPLGPQAPELHFHCLGTMSSFDGVNANTDNSGIVNVDWDLWLRMA